MWIDENYVFCDRTSNVGVHHFSLEILTKIGCNFGKDFKGKVVDPLHSRPDHKKTFFVMTPKFLGDEPRCIPCHSGRPDPLGHSEDASITCGIHNTPPPSGGSLSIYLHIASFF